MSQFKIFRISDSKSTKGLSGFDKVPSWIRDEEHMIDQNCVGFQTVALIVLNSTWNKFQVEIKTVWSLKIKNTRGFYHSQSIINMTHDV